MTFAEKLNALMNVTGVASSELTKTLGVDRSTVSRLRSGARGIPKLPMLVQISECLSAHSGGGYKLSALRELTGSPRLRHTPTEKQLAEILCAWFMSDKEPPKSQVGSLISGVEAYQPSATEEYAPSGVLPPALAASRFAVYTGSEGKRQAVRDLLHYSLGLDKPCTIRLSTDEDLGWFVEDPAFSAELSAGLRQLAGRGHTFQRIQPPSSQLEYTLNSIERWLSIYMTGSVTQYYYPFSRDDLYRRTLFVVPGHMVMYASSLANQREDLIAVLSTDRDVVDACDRAFDRMLNRCRRTMIMHTAERPRELFDCLVKMASVEAAGIYKSSALSTATLPHELIERIETLGSGISKYMTGAFTERAEARDKVLKNHVITDIMYLQPVQTVIDGKAPVLGTSPLEHGQVYYTPEEYAAHIERILWYLEKYPNYQAVLTDDPLWDNIIIYAKDGAHTLLIKESPPTAIFEITEQTMSDSIWDYLRRIAEEQMLVGARQLTADRLREELSNLRAHIRRKPRA